ncbi:hypothetical protein D7Z54_27190 [Salibacterium salarium]|uniref:Uncharacterized protein n=1 Tax=Salibacterium salarium TaxID=284579 RepID=A0A3R9WNI8_9BACI|nr:hypothetical protein [Salibacterium salarium]RSL30181.1 hypothetical protein D7Z54_27190 [Salibacterium salarium]
MAKKKTKPALGMAGSILLIIWGTYRLSTVSFSSYVWIVPMIFVVTGIVGGTANLLYFRRGVTDK